MKEIINIQQLKEHIMQASSQFLAHSTSSSNAKNILANGFLMQGLTIDTLTFFQRHFRIHSCFCHYSKGNSLADDIIDYEFWKTADNVIIEIPKKIIELLAKNNLPVHHWSLGKLIADKHVFENTVLQKTEIAKKFNHLICDETMEKFLQTNREETLNEPDASKNYHYEIPAHFVLGAVRNKTCTEERIIGINENRFDNLSKSEQSLIISKAESKLPKLLENRRKVFELCR